MDFFLRIWSGIQWNIKSYSVQLQMAFCPTICRWVKCNQVKTSKNWKNFSDSPFVWSWRTLWCWSPLARLNSARELVSSQHLFDRMLTELCSSSSSSVWNIENNYHHPPQADCLAVGFWTKCSVPLGGFHEPKPGHHGYGWLFLCW